MNNKQCIDCGCFNLLSHRSVTPAILSREKFAVSYIPHMFDVLQLEKVQKSIFEIL